MKANFYLTVIFFVFLSSCQNCNEDCSQGVLQFDLPLQAYGIKDTLNIGDTIRVLLEVPDKLAERYSGHVYDLIDYNFFMITYMTKFDSLPTTADSKGTFEWITLQGESIYVGDVFLVKPSYSNHTYYYEILIIAKQKGLYAFAMNSDGGRLNPLKKLAGPCSQNPVEVFMSLENDSNTNYQFVKLSPDPLIRNLPQQQFEEAAAFCFFVR